ncbi:ice-binding family protein [Salinibacterium sp. TMP30]|uniref:ice-binding family protein n=1 Tax=Salinibacterium sp. TMP30 TaxID=3138237 RepID=UPI00313A038E
MNKNHFCFRRSVFATTALVAALGVALVSATPALARTTIDGPIDLGASASFGVLGASALTNTGPSVINGDIGVSPGTSITGFTGLPDGTFTGTEHATDAVAAQAQSDLTSAYNVAASLTPTTSGLAELSGLSLTPGVYAGGELSLSGNLTLAGSASSVWVFQAESTLITSSASTITLTGGASACNVFWQIGSSATLADNSLMVGTVMANQSITAVTGATIEGRLLANTGAVTLDTNQVTVPTGCSTTFGTISTSPEITSGAPASATVGTPYTHAVTATGTPSPTFALTTGSLPPGLVLDTASGVISGTPTTIGSFAFSVTAGNGTTPDVTATYTLAVAAVSAAGADTLPATGSDVVGSLLVALILALAGGIAVIGTRIHPTASRSGRHTG